MQNFFPSSESLPSPLKRQGVAIMEKFVCLFSDSNERRIQVFSLHPTMYPISGISDGTSSPCFDVSHFPSSDCRGIPREKGADKMCLNMSESHKQLKTCSTKLSCLSNEIFGVLPHLRPKSPSGFRIHEAPASFHYAPCYER
jgi:hypothetical protein